MEPTANETAGEKAPEKAIDLGGHREGHPERLDRGAHGNTLVEAEHLGRYRWIATQAEGKRVLDAGCGTGYGTELLAEAGAKTVTGVDLAEDVLDAVRPRMPDNVSLEAADLHDLPFEDDSFDLIVCFEVLEHLERPEDGIDELTRVLADGGVLAISSPNHSVFPQGNPHHVHEYVPDELRDSLKRRLGNVRLVRQHAWASSAILGDDELAANNATPVESQISKTGAIEPGQEIFTLALASDGELPEVPNTVVIGPAIDQKADVETHHAVREHNEQLWEQRRRYEQTRDELEEVRKRLTEAEQELADLPAIYGERVALDAITSSVSWRVTAPLRKLKALIGTGAPPARRRFKSLLATVLYRLRNR